jgi:hypothetical protein
LLFSFENTVPQ